MKAPSIASRPRPKNPEGTVMIAAEDAVDPPVLDGEALLPVFELEADDPDFPGAPVEVATAPEELEAAVAARKRSLDWKVWQLEEAGITGVYGGGPFRGSGIDHVKVWPPEV